MTTDPDVEILEDALRNAESSMQIRTWGRVLPKALAALSRLESAANRRYREAVEECARDCEEQSRYSAECGSRDGERALLHQARRHRSLLEKGEAHGCR